MATQKKLEIRGRKIIPETNSVEYKGVVQQVEPLLIKLLLFLISGKGEVLSKDEIMKAVWKGRIVTADSLTQAISKLRKLLADQEGELIETIRGVGYRFNFKPKREKKLLHIGTGSLWLIIGLLLYLLFGSGLVAWVQQIL